MATQFQNRLVGTIVLAAVGVIFLPSILDGEKVSHQDNFIEMPEQPTFVAEEKNIVFDKQAILDQLPEKPQPVREQANDEQMLLESDPSQKSDTKPQTENQQQTETTLAESNDVELVDELPVDDRNGSAWVIQLGSFRHEKNVEVLLKKLRAQGFVAFTRPIETTSGTLTKVFVGPDLSREKLESALPKLKQLTNLNGKVTTFLSNG